MPVFYHFGIETLPGSLLCLGERLKKGTFRPTLTTIPSTQITGALCAALGRGDLWAIGYLEKYEFAYVTHTPRDVWTDAARSGAGPLTVQALRGVQGHIFVTHDMPAPLPTARLRLSLGGQRSKGFGECQAIYVETVQAHETAWGRLRSRLLEEDAPRLGIDPQQEPGLLYGYLFKPRQPEPGTTSTSGVYKRALLEESWVHAYSFIVR